MASTTDEVCISCFGPHDWTTCENRCKLCGNHHHRQTCPKALQFFDVDQDREDFRVLQRLNNSNRHADEELLELGRLHQAQGTLGRLFAFEDQFLDGPEERKGKAKAKAKDKDSKADPGQASTTAPTPNQEKAAPKKTKGPSPQGPSPVIALFTAKLGADCDWALAFGRDIEGLDSDKKQPFRELAKKQVRTRLVIPDGALHRALMKHLGKLPEGFEEGDEQLVLAAFKAISERAKDSEGDTKMNSG